MVLHAGSEDVTADEAGSRSFGADDIPGRRAGRQPPESDVVRVTGAVEPAAAIERATAILAAHHGIDGGRALAMLRDHAAGLEAESAESAAALLESHRLLVGAPRVREVGGVGGTTDVAG